MSWKFDYSNDPITKYNLNLYTAEDIFSLTCLFL